MNIIPTIFNERKITHTIIGGIEKKTEEPPEEFSVILLNRGGRYYRTNVFENLTRLGFDSIISIESAQSSSTVEDLSAQFPSVKFLIAGENLTIGEMINTGMAETLAPFVLVIWNDMHLSLSRNSALLKTLLQEDFVCTAPILFSEKGEPVLNQIVPSLSKNLFSTEQFPFVRDKTETIYPYDFVGIYNRSKCMQLGGFDYTINNPYWQNLDFGMRAFLWGEVINITVGFPVRYEEPFSAEDISIDSSYHTFYLKNLAPRIYNDEAYMPKKTFFTYVKKAGVNPFQAYSYFKEAGRWLKVNKYRFKINAYDLISQWEPMV